MQAPDTFFMRLRQYTHFCRGWGAGLPARTGGNLPVQVGVGDNHRPGLGLDGI